MSEIEKLKRSIADMEELVADVSANQFIPKKFRAAPFTAELRTKYVAYLKRELQRLKSRLFLLNKRAALNAALN